MPMVTPDAAGLAAATEVFTLAGSIPVEKLQPGARVITRSGAQTLRDIHRTDGLFHLRFDRPEVVLTAHGQVAAAA